MCRLMEEKKLKNDQVIKKERKKSFDKIFHVNYWKQIEEGKQRNGRMMYREDDGMIMKTPGTS